MISNNITRLQLFSRFLFFGLQGRVRADVFGQAGEPSEYAG